MRGLALPVALAALVALSGVALVAALRPQPPPSRAEQAETLAAELRCPDCQGLSVADSPSRAAAEIRRQIDEQLASGQSADDVRRHFVERYGEWILLAPVAAVAWWVPFAAVGLGALGLLAWLRAGPGSPIAADARPLVTDADRQRIRDEAEALDA